MSSKWDKIKHFTPNENWGNPDLMSVILLYKLDDFREYLNTPIVVLHGTDGDHVANSQHWFGNAVDIVVPNFDGSCFDLILAAERFGFTGLGYYPDWTYNGEVVGGLHLDVRSLDRDPDGTLNYKHSRWLGLKDPKTGKNKYYPLSFETLLKYAVV